MTATIEDEVRAMLARRAADVADRDDEAAPPLPTGLRIAVDDRLPAPPGRTRVLALAAAVVVLLGIAGVLVATRDTDVERTDTTDQPTTTAPSRPAHLALLPLGVDPTVGPVRGIGRPAPTPEEASDALASEAFGEDVAPNAPFAGWDPDEPPVGYWAAYRTPLVELDPAAWGAADADVIGTVTARQTDAGWYVVAVTNAALDLRDVAFDGQGLAGEVRSTSSAPLRVVVSTTMGEELAKSDLTTFAGSVPPDGPSVLRLDDLDIDAGGQPVVLRVEAGDRPGQVGIDGVSTAALATVVLPAPTGPAATDPPSTEATTEPAVATSVAEASTDPVTQLPQGLAVDDLEPLWSTAADGATVAGPSDVAVGYLADRLAGLAAADVALSEEPTRDRDVVLVRWHLPDGGPEAVGGIVTRRDPSGWVVVAALRDDIDLTGVEIADGWATGEVAASIEGEWTIGLAPQPGSLSLTQWQNLLEYLSTLDVDVPIAAGTSQAVGPMPTDLPDGPLTLLVVGRERDGSIPFAEVAFVP